MDGEFILSGENVMIIGTPYQFSIIAKVLDEWNEERQPFYNGILLFCIDGALFPKEIVTATLGADIPELKKNLLKIIVDEKIFSKEKECAFREMYMATFPDDNEVDNDYQYLISPTTLSDLHCFVFAVSNGKQTKILASKLDYTENDSYYSLDGIYIAETVISNDELHKIVLALEHVLE